MEITEKFREAVKSIVTTNAEYEKMIDNAYSQAPVFLEPDELIAMFADMETRISRYIEPAA